MDLNFFENDIFWKFFNKNLNNKIKIKFERFLKNCLKNFIENILRIFPKSNHLRGC
jgi:hypothetical protein